MKGINPDKEKIFTIRRRNMMRDMLEPEDKVEWFLGPHAKLVRVLSMPDGHKDLTDWVKARKEAKAKAC
jgi:hypothetical protein